jgi:hypothetical protein
MTSSSTAASVSRRTALAGLGAGSLGLAFAVTARRASAQGAAPDFSDHPLAGTWMAMANPPLEIDPQVAATSLFAADGTVLLMFPLTQAEPQGVQFNSAYVGTWEPDGERHGHFTAVQVLSDADGAFLGTVTVDGYPEVNPDGQTFVDDGSKVTVTIRDPTGAIVQQVMPTGAPAGRPVTGTRIGPGSPGFPTETPAAATPTS